MSWGIIIKHVLSRWWSPDSTRNRHFQAQTLIFHHTFIIFWTQFFTDAKFQFWKKYVTVAVLKVDSRIHIIPYYFSAFLFSVPQHLNLLIVSNRVLSCAAERVSSRKKGRRHCQDLEKYQGSVIEWQDFKEPTVVANYQHLVNIFRFRCNKESRVGRRSRKSTGMIMMKIILGHAYLMLLIYWILSHRGN